MTPGERVFQLAGRPITWGVLGTGMVARQAMIPALARAPWASLVAVASRDIQRATALASAHGVPRAYGDYQALLDDPTIACVYIALPNGAHREWVERAAAAGKHILCEKPLGRDAAEVEAMRAACERAGVTLMEALMYRFHPRIERALALVAEDAIGAPRSVQVSFCFSLTDTANYRLQAGEGGGALLDVGGYCVHAARLFLGAEPVSIQANGQFGSTGVDMDVSALLDFGAGRSAQIMCSFAAAEYQRVTLVGTHGVMELPRAFTAWRDETAPILITRNGHTETLLTPPADPYDLMAEAFTQAVMSGIPAPYALEESLATARVVEAVARALRSGRRETLTPR